MTPDNEKNEGMSLLGVEKPKPVRSDTLTTFMKNTGLTDDNVLFEDDKVIGFHPGRQSRDFSHMFDYNKENDTYDVTNESAKNFNDRLAKLHTIYGDWIKQSGKDDFETLREMYINNYDEYANGIRKRSGNNIGEDRLDFLLRNKFGTPKDIANFLERNYNK